MVFPEARLTANAGSRCPSCEAANPPGRDACRECGARLPQVPAERPLPEEMPSPSLADRSERAFVPVEYERRDRQGGKKLLDADGEIKVDRADMVEKESYMCLICGSTVPALADKCPVCGTIFVSETEAHTFSGIPVARLPRKGELEAAEARKLEVPRVDEAVNLELPLPRPLSAHALKEADILPVMEPAPERKAVIKKKVVKKAVRK